MSFNRAKPSLTQTVTPLFKQVITQTRHVFRDILSSKCQLCELPMPISEQWICSPCNENLPLNGHACNRCATPLPSDTVSTCGQCLLKPPAIDSLHAAFQYVYPINRWHHHYKFQRRYALSQWFAKQLLHSIRINQAYETAHAYKSDPANELSSVGILPVPLHRQRFRRRGYNQASLIGDSIASSLSLPCFDSHVTRIKKTPAQSGLNQKDRRRNIAGAFKVIKPLASHIIVIDDVYTTGATLNELAQTLKSHGVQRVDAWVVAYAPLQHSARG